MKTTKAERLNKRAIRNAALDVVSYLNICDGEIIADIGSGGGLLTFEFAKLTESGLVVAADTNADLLKYIEATIERQGIRNVETINIQDIGRLHKYQFDLIFLRNVFHHIQNPVDYFSRLRSCLKENGRIAIIDWNEQANFLMRATGHYTPNQMIIKDMAAAGYICTASYTHLSKQSFFIFC